MLYPQTSELVLLISLIFSSLWIRSLSNNLDLVVNRPDIIESPPSTINNDAPIVNHKYSTLASKTQTDKVKYSVIISPLLSSDESNADDYFRSDYDRPDAFLQIFHLKFERANQKLDPIFFVSDPYMQGRYNLDHNDPHQQIGISFNASDYGNAVLMSLFPNIEDSKQDINSDAFPFDKLTIYNSLDPMINHRLYDFQLEILLHLVDKITTTIFFAPIFQMSFQEMVERNEQHCPESQEDEAELSHTAACSEISTLYLLESDVPLSFHIHCDPLQMPPIDHGVNVADLENVCKFVEKKYYSSFAQWGQDEEVIQYFKGKQLGTYLDIGANDGVTNSNTYALERYFGWSGLMIEPLPNLIDSLNHNRGGKAENRIMNVCVHNRTFEADFMAIVDVSEFSGVLDDWAWKHNNAYNLDAVRIKVPCIHIQDVLDQHQITHVDFMSIDTEGADMYILQAIDWSRFDATVVSVECHEHFEMEGILIDFFLNKLGYVHFKKLSWDFLFFK